MDGDFTTARETASGQVGASSTVADAGAGDQPPRVISRPAPEPAPEPASESAPDQVLDFWVVPTVFGAALMSALSLGATSIVGEGTPFWACFVLSAVLGAGATALTVWKRPSWRIAAAFSATVAAMVVAVVGVSVWNSSRPAAWPGPVCPPPETADVLASPDLAATTTALVHAFVLQHPVDHGCPRYLLHVTQASRQAAATALAAESWDSQWAKGSATALGVPPGLWVADLNVDVAPVGARAAAASVASPVDPRTTRVVARSRLVLALPDGAPPAGPLTWRTAVAGLAAQGRTVVRPEPGSSQVGDLSLLLDYPAGRDSHADRDYERVYAQGFHSGNWRRDDLATLLRDAHDVLCGQPRPSGRSAPALVLPEFVLKGRASADDRDRSAGTAAGCSGPDGETSQIATTVPLTGRSASLELAVTPLRWHQNDPEPAGAEVLARFTEWLTGSDGRAALERLGWDTEPVPDQAVPGQELADAAAAYHAARSPGRLLLGVDGSKSMTRVWPALTQAVEQVLARLGPEDQVGLSTFVAPSAATRSGPTTWPGLVPRVKPGAAGPAHRAGLLRQLSALDPGGLQDGDTPLREAIPALIERAGAGGEAVVPGTVVVLTDGASLTGGPDWRAIQEQARVANVQVLVVVLGATDLSAGMPARVNLAYLQAPGGDAGQDLLRTLNGMLWRSR